MKEQIGKIQGVKMGLVGYQERQFGLQLTLGSDKGSWGVCTTINGGWAMEPDEYAKWTIEDQSAQFATASREIISLLHSAKVEDVSDLVGKPVMVEFERSTLKDWRILEEAL